MSAITVPTHAHDEHGHTMTVGEFINTYVFSRDHKIIGIQFLFSTLLWFLVGGLLALGIGLGRRHAALSDWSPWLPDLAGMALGLLFTRKAARQ